MTYSEFILAHQQQSMKPLQHSATGGIPPFPASSVSFGLRVYAFKELKEAFIF